MAQLWCGVVQLECGLALGRRGSAGSTSGSCESRLGKPSGGPPLEGTAMWKLERKSANVLCMNAYRKKN